MKRKKCPVCRRRDVAEINYKLALGGRGSTRTVAHEYGIDYLIMQKHRGHKMPKSKKAPLSDEALRQLEEGEKILRKHFGLEEEHASGESRSS